jgi:hypothetical protein
VYFGFADTLGGEVLSIWYQEGDDPFFIHVKVWLADWRDENCIMLF